MMKGIETVSDDSSTTIAGSSWRMDSSFSSSFGGERRDALGSGGPVEAMETAAEEVNRFVLYSTCFADDEARRLEISASVE